MSKRQKKMMNYNRYKKEQSKIDKNTDMATPEQLETITQFTQKFSQSLQKDIMDAQMLSTISASNGAYQPYLAQQVLQDVNFNPLKATSSQIENWLLNPQLNDISLRGFSQYLENSIGQYQRAVHYFSDMLSFDYMVLPSDGNNKDLVNKKEYQNSYFNACKFVKKMNVKNKFNAMSLTIMQDGVSYWYKVENSNSIGFLQIPTDWCRITGTWNLGWTGEVDLAFFDRMYGLGDSIPELYHAYKVFMDKRIEGLKGDALAPFQYFPLPIDKTWIFSFDPNKATKVPPLASNFGVSLDVMSYRNILRDQSLLDLWKVIALKIPLKKNNDNLIMTYEEASEIVSLIQSTLPDNMSVFASPFDADPINTNQINTLDKTIALANENFYTSLGTSGEFFGKETKSSKALQISQQKDFLFSSKPIYAQFSNMVNWFLMNEIKTYSWQVSFSGNEIEKDASINTALKLTTTANFPVSYLASVVGFEPSDFDGLINLENSLGLKEKMKPLVSAFQQGKGSNEGGKPKESMQNITTEGLETRDSRGDGS